MATKKMKPFLPGQEDIATWKSKPDLHEAARQVAINIKILRDACAGGKRLGEYERDVLDRVEHSYLPAIKGE